MDAREIVIVITGAHKALALAKCIEEGVNHMYTVSALQMHPHAMIVCDDDATLELKVKTVKVLSALMTLIRSISRALSLCRSKFRTRGSIQGLPCQVAEWEGEVIWCIDDFSLVVPFHYMSAKNRVVFTFRQDIKLIPFRTNDSLIYLHPESFYQRRCWERFIFDREYFKRGWKPSSLISSENTGVARWGDR